MGTRSGSTTIRRYKPVEPEPVDRRQALHVKITDAKTGKPLDAAISIAGMEFDSIVKATGKSSTNSKWSPIAT